MWLLNTIESIKLCGRHSKCLQIKIWTNLQEDIDELGKLSYNRRRFSNFENVISCYTQDTRIQGEC